MSSSKQTKFSGTKAAGVSILALCLLAFSQLLALLIGNMLVAGGRISGTVFGAMVIGIISNGLNLIGVSSYWQLIVKGLIIACAVVLDSQKGNLALLRKKK